MTINYQSADHWSLSASVNGYPFDELRSVLQKSIRRGLTEEALLAGYEIYASGRECEEMLWRRLEIIATEDVGSGLPLAPVLIETLYQQQKRMDDPVDRWMYATHAIRLLADAKKDYHVDLHTRRGVAMGRGPENWWSEGARLDNEVDGLNPKYGEYLRRLYAAPPKAPA
jgi:hypothetical protein